MSAVLWLVNSTPGRIILGVLAFMTWLHFHDQKIADRARGECQAETLKRTLTELERQKAAADKVIADAEKQQAVTDNEIADLTRQRDAANAAQQGKGKACEPVGNDVLERLRNIR